MKRFLITILFLSVLATPLVAQTMSEANEAYKRGDYPAAIGAYSAILDAGYENADLYYNLGNAYYRTDRFGMAILNYERALRLEPNFAEARQNLALANARTEDKITPLPEFLLAKWYKALVGLLPTVGWLWTIIALLLLVAVAVYFLVFGSSYGLRKAGLVGLIVFAIFLLVAVACTSSSVLRRSRHDRAVVTQPMVVVKGSPDVSGVDKLVLHDGTTLIVGESLDGWYKIHLADGNTGWLPEEDITII